MSSFALKGGTGGVSKVDIDQFQEALDKQVNELPETFFLELNGGVNLSEQTKLSPKAKHNDLFILGEYSVSPSMGRFITIYYGSFQKVFSMDTEICAEKEIRKVLRHEFRHHLESLAMIRDLELEDERMLNEYFRHSLKMDDSTAQCRRIARNIEDTEASEKETAIKSTYSPWCTSTVLRTSKH